jgi:hypothetical protein
MLYAAESGSDGIMSGGDLGIAFQTHAGRQASRHEICVLCCAVLLCIVRSDLLFVVCCRYAPMITKSKQNVFLNTTIFGIILLYLSPVLGL